MSTLDLSLLLHGVQRGVMGRTSSFLRMVLVQDEAMSLPRARMRLHILSGTAWVTQGGKDALLPAGTCFEASAGSDRAVISTVGLQPVCFEMRR